MAAHLKMGRFSPRILMKTIFFVCLFFPTIAVLTDQR